MELLTAPQNWPFGSALALMVALAVIEGFGLMLAASPSSWLDGLLPNAVDGVDGPLGWLHLGKVPILVLLMLFLAGFALTGYAVQGIVHAILGFWLPTLIAIIPALFGGLSTVSAMGSLLAKLNISDETSAVSELSLIGRAGVVVRGTARADLAAEAKVRDHHGKVNYVMVVPDVDGQTFSEGAAVLLVKKVGASYRCISNPHPELL
jgi:hypothetical protein